jgi:hypothetical protein
VRPRDGAATAQFHLLERPAMFIPPMSALKRIAECRFPDKFMISDNYDVIGDRRSFTVADFAGFVRDEGPV